MQTNEIPMVDVLRLGAPTWPNGFDLDPINLYMQLRDSDALTRAAAE